MVECGARGWVGVKGQRARHGKRDVRQTKTGGSGWYGGEKGKGWGGGGGAESATDTSKAHEGEWRETRHTELKNDNHQRLKPFQHFDEATGRGVKTTHPDEL